VPLDATFSGRAGIRAAASERDCEVEVEVVSRGDGRTSRTAVFCWRGGTALEDASRGRCFDPEPAPSQLELQLPPTVARSLASAVFGLGSRRGSRSGDSPAARFDVPLELRFPDERGSIEVRVSVECVDADDPSRRWVGREDVRVSVYPTPGDRYRETARVSVTGPSGRVGPCTMRVSWRPRPLRDPPPFQELHVACLREQARAVGDGSFAATLPGTTATVEEGVCER
jgi:hypothetical protein